MSELVKIGTYLDMVQAVLAKSKLEAYGIYCFMQDENLVQTDWLRTIAYGGVKLFVREADVQQAMDILNEHELPGDLPGG